MARAIRAAVEGGRLARARRADPAPPATPRPRRPTRACRSSTRRRGIEQTVDELLDGWEAAWSGRRTRPRSRDCALPGIQYEDPFTREPLRGPTSWPRTPSGCGRRSPTRASSARASACSTGRFVAAPCKLAGTHRGALEGLPATSRFVVVHGVFYCELRARPAVLRVRAFFDLYDAAVQLGVLPSRGTLGEKALLVLRGFGLRAGSGLA